MEKPNKISWQDKRIKAMDRTIFRKKFTHEYLVDEYCAQFGFGLFAGFLIEFA